MTTFFVGWVGGFYDARDADLCRRDLEVVVRAATRGGTTSVELSLFCRNEVLPSEALVLANRPTTQQLAREIERLASRARLNDHLVFFVANHASRLGLLVSRTGDP